MSRKIQVLRGEEADIPILDVGEFGYAMDTQRLFIGNGEENLEVTLQLNTTSFSSTTDEDEKDKK